ncbi:MAG: hypothetical protein R3B72_39230 [Polyangiaceae bacterium]
MSDAPPVVSSAPPGVQRKASGDLTVSAAPIASYHTATGQMLEPTTQRFMESRFGRDLRKECDSEAWQYRKRTR